MDRQDKIQNLLITHLLEKGHIELTLPDGLVLEMGIVQEDKNGQMVKADNYSWLIATQRDRTISMDSYNFALRYEDDGTSPLFDDVSDFKAGKSVRMVTAI